MNYNDAVLRSDAMEWLIDHYDEYPKNVPGGAENLSRNVSGRMFEEWRWVVLLDGELVFANCIQSCITKQDFDNRKVEVIS